MRLMFPPFSLTVNFSSYLSVTSCLFLLFLFLVSILWFLLLTDVSILFFLILLLCFILGLSTTVLTNFSCCTSSSSRSACSLRLLTVMITFLVDFRAHFSNQSIHSFSLLVLLLFFAYLSSLKHFKHKKSSTIILWFVTLEITYSILKSVDSNTLFPHISSRYISPFIGNKEGRPTIKTCEV